MKGYNQERTKKFLAGLTIVIIVVLIGHVISIGTFNAKVHHVKGSDDSKASYLTFEHRKDSTSSWVKRDFDLDGKKVDLKASTIDGTFFNNYSEKITSWNLKINIKGDCFLNNAWCGKVEIHQNTGTRREIVQKLDLRNYKLKNVKVDHLYDGDLLIPLKKGDYIVYYPSKKDDEIPINSNAELTMGTIFYYLDKVDLSNYTVNYSYHKDLTQGIGFYVTAGLLLLWLIIFIMMQVAKISYRKAAAEMDIRVSGIKYVSDIYDIIYMIHLDTDELTVIKSDEESEKNRPKNTGARDQLLNLFMVDATEDYMELMQDFGDIQTLNERLLRDSIACNYLSRSHGWSQIRFFAMDREEGKPLTKVLFTIQNIHDERLDLEENEIKVSKSSTEKKAKSIFFDILSERAGITADTVDAAATAITEHINAADDDAFIKEQVSAIHTETNKLQQMNAKLKNASDIYAGTIKLEHKNYSFADLMKNAYHEASQELAGRDIELKTEISHQIPDILYGDPSRLSQVLSYLLTNSIDHTDTGTILISVFGSLNEDKEHLLISIKDTGRGISEKNLSRLIKEWSDKDHNWNFSKEEPGIGLTMIHELLRLMDSGLHVISEPGSGSEFYFEIDQEIVDPSPIGKLEFE